MLLFKLGQIDCKKETTLKLQFPQYGLNRKKYLFLFVGISWP